MNQQEYQFEIIAENVDANNLTAFLKDKYLKITTPLNLGGTTKVKFSITADAASAPENRFSIVFEKPAVVINPALTIYPNPVNNGIINLRFNNMPGGNYTVRVINSLGQTIVSRQINHAQGSSIEKLQMKSKGVFHVEIMQPGNSKFSTKVIAN